VKPLRELAKHTLVYGLGSLATSLIGFLLIPVYTRKLSPEEFGDLALFLVLYGALTRVYDLGLTNSVGRFYFDYRSEQRRLDEMLSTVTAFLAAWGALLTAGLFAVARPLTQLLVGSPGPSYLTELVGITLLLEGLAIPPLTLIRMEERSLLWVLITLLRVLLGLALNIYFVVFVGLGVEGVLLSNALTAVAVLLVAFWPLAPRLRMTVRKDVLADMLRFGLPFFPALLGIWVLNLSDRYLLQVFRTTHEVGLYALGCRIAQAMGLAVSAFSLGWAPLRFKIYERQDARDVYRNIATAYFAVTALLTVMLSVFTPEILLVAATPEYFPAAVVVAPVVAGNAFYGFFLITSTGMGVVKKTNGLAVAVAIAAAANVGANLLLVPRYGMLAAAYTTLGAFALLAWLTYVLSQRLYAIRYDWGRIGLIGAWATVVIVAKSWLGPASLGAGILASSALVVMFAAALLPLLAKAGLLRALWEAIFPARTASHAA
jgi:O-antigen/teichoic acid export membrane protein